MGAAASPQSALSRVQGRKVLPEISGVWLLPCHKGDESAPDLLRSLQKLSKVLSLLQEDRVQHFGKVI